MQYKLVYVKYTDTKGINKILKLYNKKKQLGAIRTNAKHGGHFKNNLEGITITLFYNAKGIPEAIKQGRKIAQMENAEIYTIVRTEIIATEGI